MTTKFLSASAFAVFLLFAISCDDQHKKRTTQKAAEVKARRDYVANEVAKTKSAGVDVKFEIKGIEAEMLIAEITGQVTREIREEFIDQSVPNLKQLGFKHFVVMQNGRPLAFFNLDMVTVQDEGQE